VLEHIGVIPCVKTMAVTEHEAVSLVRVAAAHERLVFNPSQNEILGAKQIPLEVNRWQWRILTEGRTRFRVELRRKKKDQSVRLVFGHLDASL
jgi:hypothetical protein